MASITPGKSKQSRYGKKSVNGAGTATVQRSLYGLGRIANVTGKAVHYEIHDGLGNVRLLTDASGKITARSADGPFGQSLGDRSSFGYTGEPELAGGSLSDLRARQYSPSLGRFLTRDPMGASFSEPRTLNPYTYTHNNPTNLVNDHRDHDTYRGGRSASSCANSTSSISLPMNGPSSSP